MITSTESATPKCRTCVGSITVATKFHELTEQTDSERYPQKSLADLLWDVAKIDIKSENFRKLPQQICGNCVRKLKNAYNFVVQAQRVNECLMASLHADIDEEESQTEDNRNDCLSEAPIDIPTNNLQIKIEVSEENLLDTLNEAAATNDYNDSRKRRRSTDNENPKKIAIGAMDTIKIESTQACSQENYTKEKTTVVISDPITNETDWRMDEDHNFDSIGFDSYDNKADGRQQHSARDAVRGNFSGTSYCAKERDYHHCEVMDKLNFMMQEIYKISMNVNTLLETKHDTVNIGRRFPLRNEEELNELENILDDNNCVPFINELKSIVRDNTVIKSLSEIFSEKLILQYNLEGKNKKLALNSYPKTLKVLFRGHELYQTYAEFATDLRVGLKRCKNRYHKAKQREKQSASEMILTPDIPETVTF